MGTGGTITGAGRRLKESNPQCHVLGVEPRLGVHVQGLKSLEDGFIPPVLDESVLDGKIIVGNRHAFSHARRAMLAEGIFGGISSGAVLHAAMRAAGRIKRGNIVMIFADAGWKYLGTDLWSMDDTDPAIDHREDPLDDVLWW
jgi:cysteine synthase B